jgi:hypothetical protein
MKNEGHFVLIKKTPLHLMNIGETIPESDYSVVENGIFYQFKYIKPVKGKKNENS